MGISLGIKTLITNNAACWHTFQGTKASTTTVTLACIFDNNMSQRDRLLSNSYLHVVFRHCISFGIATLNRSNPTYCYTFQGTKASTSAITVTWLFDNNMSQILQIMYLRRVLGHSLRHCIIKYKQCCLLTHFPRNQDKYNYCHCCLRFANHTAQCKLTLKCGDQPVSGQAVYWIPQKFLSDLLSML